jgi:hypothetical protein
MSSLSKPPFLLELRSSNVFILSTVSVAIFTDIFLYSVIVPVIPFALTERADVPPEKGNRSTRGRFWAHVAEFMQSDPPYHF